MQHRWRLLSLFSARPSKPPAGVEASQANHEIDPALAILLADVQARQLERASLIWRREPTEDCPNSIRIRTGDLDRTDYLHFKECDHCNGIYESTRFARLVHQLRRALRQTSADCPVHVGIGIAALAVACALMFILGDPMQPANGNAGSTQVRPVPVSVPTPEPLTMTTVPNSPVASVEQWTEGNIARNLGSQYYSRLVRARENMAVYISPESGLGQQLRLEWLRLLPAGNGCFAHAIDRQLRLSTMVPAESVVEIARLQADLATVVNPEIFQNMVDLQLRTAQRKRKLDPGATRETIAAAVIKEARTQRATADKASIGQRAALKAAYERLGSFGQVAHR